MKSPSEKFTFIRNIWYPFLAKLGLPHYRDRLLEREQSNRIIFINNVPPDLGDTSADKPTDIPLNYASNRIITSKYTFFNFLPKNIYEQFRRLANFYFLVNIIIMFILPDPPKSPVVNSIPLLVVITITALKQAYEDFLRHYADREVNDQVEKVIRQGQLILLKRHEIRVGDLVEVGQDQQFPCDMILVYSGASEQACHITTANLDGETNLKVRQVVEGLVNGKSGDIGLEELAGMRGMITCDKPSTELYDIRGKIQIGKREIPLCCDHLLLRGATLRLAPFIYGCAIYTGRDTKLMLNSKFKANKLSRIERTVNKFIFFFLALLLLFILIGLAGSLYNRELFSKHWYLQGREPRFYFSNKFIYYLIEQLFFLGMCNTLIPISMYMQIELQRFIGTKFFEWDLEMYDEKTNQPAKANNSNLNEDLGQVDYLFSDKTGTLTENEMVFKQFSLDKRVFEYRNGLVYELDNDKPEQLDQEPFRRFFEVLSLCHTVQVDEQATPKYQASSPDEFSFVCFCETVGIKFEGDFKDRHSVYKHRRVDYLGQRRSYELIHTLTFDSDRKRMSVVVRCLSTGLILLLSKGAEEAIFAVLDNHETNNKSIDSDSIKPVTNKKTRAIRESNSILKRFARRGWRTLAVAYRILNESECQHFIEQVNQAMINIEKREEALLEAYTNLECNMQLLGTTAVEDRLQEDVGKTLVALRTAGIKVWVLTGDKKETAVNISKSCRHITSQMELLELGGSVDKMDETLRGQNKRVKSQSEKRHFAYVIEGRILKKVFAQGMQEEFREVCMRCEAVLCCRMTPAQKAEVVQLVKKSGSKPMTCAIGDGANDVSMIQEAHVGLGIFGKEGRNAARSADFAFAKFKFIRRALLTHGYIYYTRVSTLVLYFFYKNLVLIICQIYFAPSNAFSISNLYPEIMMAFYNIFFTACPILIFGLFEQRVKISNLSEDPTHYQSIAHNQQLSPTQFLLWNLSGLWHSAVAYLSTLFLFSPAHLGFDGKLEDIHAFGAVVYFQVMLSVHAKLLLESRYITLVTLFSLSMSLLAILVFCILPNSFIMPYPITVLTEEQSLYWLFYRLFSYPTVWACLAVGLCAALLPDLCFKVIQGLGQQVKKAREENFKRKLLYFRDLPDNHEQQRRKRMGKSKLDKTEEADTKVLVNKTDI